MLRNVSHSGAHFFLTSLLFWRLALSQLHCSVYWNRFSVLIFPLLTMFCIHVFSWPGISGYLVLGVLMLADYFRNGRATFAAFWLLRSMIVSGKEFILFLSDWWSLTSANLWPICLYHWAGCKFSTILQHNMLFDPFLQTHISPF